MRLCNEGAIIQSASAQLVRNDNYAYTVRQFILRTCFAATTFFSSRWVLSTCKLISSVKVCNQVTSQSWSQTEPLGYLQYPVWKPGYKHFLAYKILSAITLRLDVCWYSSYQSFPQEQPSLDVLISFSHSITVLNKMYTPLSASEACMLNPSVAGPAEIQISTPMYSPPVILPYPCNCSQSLYSLY